MSGPQDRTDQVRPKEIGPNQLSPIQVARLLGIFTYEELGPFILLKDGPDEAPTAVWGDWNGDGSGYWETCAHCFLPLMEKEGFKL